MKSSNVSPLIITLGWIGTTVVFGAYLVNIFGFVSSVGLTYALLNLVGALLLGIRVWTDRNYSNLLLEIFFGAVAIASIVRYFFFLKHS